MTNQDKVKYLKQYKRIDARIKRKKEEKERWKELAKKVTPSYSTQPKGTNSTNKIENATEQIDTLEREINAEIIELANLRHQIQEAIYNVGDSKLQELLERRYLDGCTLEQIAVDMNYCYMHICRLHGEAMERIML